MFFLIVLSATFCHNFIQKINFTFFIFSLGVWHFRSSQREIPNRRLLREPDFAGASVPQLRPVPALHAGCEEVGGSRIPRHCLHFLQRCR